MLTMAAVRDVRWLQLVTTTLMPKQSGRVPFHDSADISIRGYHAASARRAVPVLKEVTWSRLAYSENNLHRGYKAGLIFSGANFMPGVTYTYRRKGDTSPPPGNKEYFWHIPNIYFGDYLEVSCGEDEIETPLSWRDHEFQIRNPEGQTSEWVLFTHPFDDPRLTEIMLHCADEGRRLVGLGDDQGAIESLRKAFVFADRILGENAAETVKLRQEWNSAIDNAALAKMRFRCGARIKIISGEHSGNCGEITKLGLRMLKPYMVDLGESNLVWAGDDEVELLTT